MISDDVGAQVPFTRFFGSFKTSSLLVVSEAFEEEDVATAPPLEEGFSSDALELEFLITVPEEISTSAEEDEISGSAPDEESPPQEYMTEESAKTPKIDKTEKRPNIFMP